MLLKNSDHTVDANLQKHTGRPLPNGRAGDQTPDPLVLGESVLEIPETTETVVERPFQRPVPVLLGIDGDGRVFRDPNGAPNLYGLNGRPIHLADRADHLPAPLPQFPIKTVEIEDQLEPHFRTVLAIIHMDLVDAGAMLPPVATWTIIAGEQPEQKFGHEHRVPFVARVLVEPDHLVARGFPPDPFPAAIRYGGDGVRPVLVDQVQRPPVPRVDSRADAFEIPVLQDVPPHGIHVFRDELRRRRRRRGRVERVADDVEHVPIAHGDPVGFRGLPGAWREEQETVPVTGEFPLYLIAVSGQLVVMLAGEDLVLDAKDVSRLVVHGEDVDVAPFASDRESVAVHEQIVEHPGVLHALGRIVDEAADHAVMQSVVPVWVHEPCEHVAVTDLGARDPEDIERVEPAHPLAQRLQASGIGEELPERLLVPIDGIVPHSQKHPPFPGKPMPRSSMDGARRSRHPLYRSMTGHIPWEPLPRLLPIEPTCPRPWHPRDGQDREKTGTNKKRGFLERRPPGSPKREHEKKASREPKARPGDPTKYKRRRATLPHPLECSTIAAPGLSYRVRNGTGRLTRAMTTANLTATARKPKESKPACHRWRFGNRLADARQTPIV